MPSENGNYSGLLGAPVSAEPRHIAIIMDGNGRWAKRRNKSATYGHRAGVEVVRDVVGLCRDYGVKVLTLFAFSSENWQRPTKEVNALMTLFASYLRKEVNKLHNDGVRVRFIGGRDRFSKGLLKQMEHAEHLTRANSDTTLVIAVDYGGQWDIAQAARLVAEQVKAGVLEPDQIDAQLLDSYVSLADLPKPDLCIRTAGECRVSNFLLWQLAYSEFFFTDTLWPDFSEVDMQKALASYRNRDRSYGSRSENDIDADVDTDHASDSAVFGDGLRNVIAEAK